jgi:PAS domain S-box-containing protein
MPAIQYPFIDIAVHPRVRERFSQGEALVLFSTDLSGALWANGAGAELFGHSTVYDLIDQGVNRADITFRQLAATAQQLAIIGDSRSFIIRIPQGFQRVAVQASVELISVSPGEQAILVSLPAPTRALSAEQSAAQMLKGLDDPDTHMAVIGADGEIIAASPGFASLGVTQPTARSLGTMAAAHPHGLVKRPVATGKGYLPAAIGRISSDPALYLLFAVETVLGRLDPTDAPDLSTSAVNHSVAAPAKFADAIDAVAGIEDIDEAPEETVAADLDAAADAVAAEQTTDAEPVLEAFEEVAVTETTDTGDVSDVGEDVAAFLPDDTTIEDAPATMMASDADLPEATVVAEDEVAVEPDGDEAEADEPDEAFHPEALPDEDDIAAFEPSEISEEPLVEPEASADQQPETDVVDTVATDVADIVETTETAEAQPVATSPSAAVAGLMAAPASAETAEFVFRPNSRATRFVWKIDAQGQFSEVSGEFAEAVGPHAANIIGVAFSDIAALFNLDPEGKISEALERRDTWSGKTIHWPIEGTSLAVPVDLAALPTYTRSREFDGFRGFGVVRLSDAAEDPLALGLTFGQQPDAEAAAIDDVSDDQAAEDVSAIVVEDEATDLEPVADEPVAEEQSDIVETADDTSGIADEAVASEEADVDATFAPTETTEEDATPETAAPSPRAEPPALRIVETPNRRLTDKIVQLHGVGPGLTTAEQANFREIAKRLEAFGVSASESDGDKAASPEESGNEAVEAAKPTEAADERPVKADTELQAEEASAPEADEAEAASAFEAEPAATDLPAPVDLTPADPTPADNDNEDVTEGLEETVSQMDILASFVPPRVKMTDGFSAGMIDQLPVAVLIHAGDQLMHANPEFMRLTGYRSLQDLADVGGIDALLQRGDLEGNDGRHDGMMLVTMDDDLVPVSARLQSIRWEDTTALMLALMPVANERPTVVPEVVPGDTRAADRMVEKVAKLQVEVEELRSILETATDGVVVIGADGDIRSMNRSASALFNYDDEDTRGKPFVMLFAHESQKAVLDYLSGISGHGVASVLNDGREVIGREAAGGFVPLFMTLGHLTSSSGYCAVIRDITQWKRTEDELRGAKSAAETANAHKTDFLARVSHEIRTPLNAIIGFSDMMAGERFGPIGHPRYVEYANDIGRSGRHVLDIVNDLLDISKIEAGEMELDFTSVGLNETVSEAVSLVQPQANGQRVIIRTALSQAVPPVVADLRSIKQIVLNILSNAIRFTPSGGQIVVSSAYEPNGNVVLRVRDTGIGMSRSELELAMKPFRQVAGAARKRGDGTGLGLPLTKAMVDANRAAFAISSSPNEGTLVEITFPSPRVLAT